MTDAPVRLAPGVDRMSEAGPSPTAPDAELDTGMELHRRQAAHGTLDVVARGLDPLTTTPRIGGPIPWQLENERRFMLEGQRNRQMNEAVFLNPESGWGQINQFMRGVFDRYKAQNESTLIKKPRNQEEMALQMAQLSPVKVDPTEVANIRQLAVKLDQQMKAVDPRTSFWTDPRTKKIADWLNREAGGGGVGYLSSGEQKLETGVVGAVTQPVVELAEGATGAVADLLVGGWDMGRQAVQALGGPDMGPLVPTNYVEGPDGKLYDNGAKVPSLVDGMTMMWASATGQHVQKAVEEMGRTREMEIASRNGFEHVVNSAARIAGVGLGMGVPAGAAMKGGAALFGSLTSKGLTSLGALRLAGGLGQSERAVKIIQIMGRGIGAAAGNGAYEATAYGRLDGYRNAFAHGMMMAPVLAAIGAMGRRTEWLAHNRANMPEGIAKTVGAAMEGIGFGALEHLAPDLLPSAFGFIKNPNEETWQTYTKNAAGMMLMSMAMRGRRATPGAAGYDAVTEQVQRGQERSKFAERVAEGKATPEELAKAPSDEIDLEQLGHAQKMSRSADPAERAQGTELSKKLTSEIDQRETKVNKGPAQKLVEQARLEVEQLAAGKTDAEWNETVKAEMRQLREAVRTQGRWTPEQRARFDVLADSNNMRNWKRMQSSVTEFTENQRKATEQELSMRYEMLEGGEVTKALLSSDRTATDFRAETSRRMAEQGVKYPESPAIREQRAVEEARALTERVKGKPAAEGPAKPDWMPQEDYDGLAAMAKKVGMPLQELIADAAKDAGKPYSPEATEATAAPERAQPSEGPVAAEAPAELEVRVAPIGPGGERPGGRSLRFPPTRQVEPTEGAGPVRASDIILEMQGRPGSPGLRIPFTATRVGGTEGDPVRPAIRSGHLDSRKALGVFKLFENVIRNQDARDLAVASHEWSHAMHGHMIAKRGGMDLVKAEKAQLASLPKEVVAELPKMAEGYPGFEKLPKYVQWAEAWAEWHARNLLGDPELDTRTPNASKWMRAWLAAPEQAALRPQYLRIQQMLHSYNVQGSEARVRQSIVLDTDPETASERAQKAPLLQRAADTVTKAFFDDMVEMKRAQDRYLEASGRKPEDIAIQDDPARLFDALRMTAGKQAEHYIMQGIRTPAGDNVPGLREVLEPFRGNAEDLVKYLVSVRNLELHAQGKQVQLPVQDYAETMKRVGDRDPRVKEAAAGLKRWTDALVDIVAGAGAVDPDTAKRLKDTYSLYIPFFRAVEGPKAHGQGRGVAERGTGISHIKGSTLEVRDPLVALQEVAQTMIAKAHQNQVVSALYKMAKGQDAGGLATVIPRSKVPHDHPARQVIDALEKAVPEDLRDVATQALGLDMFDVLRSLDKQAGLDAVTLFTQKVVPTGERSVIAFTPRLTAAEIDALVQQGAHRAELAKQNGKLQWLEVDSKVYESLMGIDKMPQLPEALQPIMQIVQAPRDLVRFFATGTSPGFVAANLIRDALSKPLFDREGKFRPFGGFVDVVRGAIEYHKNGEMRRLYEELGVKTSSFFNEGVKREVAGQTAGFRTKFLEWTGRIQEFFSHPENYLRMASFKDALTAARAAGKPEMQARLEALEAGKELMNFSRAGIWSRALNQMIPYFNAGLVGKRKFFGQLLWGGDVKGDEAKARVQRATLLNGLASITMPSIALWLLNKDEDWYQDLPEWRRVNYWNVKIGEDILSIPKPFEAGVIFGTLPERILDEQLPKANPVQMKEIAKTALGSYMEGIGSFLPAFIRPIFEVEANYDFFRRRELTPDWVSRSMPRDEQMTTYTTASARILSKAIGGILTPIEVEHMLGGYTAGATTRAMRFVDEVAGLKDHPLGSPMPWDRFFSQTPHGSSSYVDQLYKLGTDLEQRDDTLTGAERGLRARVEDAKRRISDLRKQSRAGKLSTADAERRAYELARPLVERSR